MKTTTILIILMSVVIAFTSMAQEIITVDVTKLDESQLRVYQQLKQQMNTNSSTLENLTPEKIDKYAQIGKAFESAFKECWSTISTDTERFAQSSAGKWVMVMVTWKIMGDDAINLVSHTIRFGVGSFLLVVGIPFFIYIFRRNCVQIPLLKSKTRVAFLTVKREYEGMSEPIHSYSAGIYGVVFAVFIGIISIIMFA